MLDTEGGDAVKSELTRIQKDESGTNVIAFL